MSDDAIDQLLEAQGYGIVSLCRDGRPYSIPVSFGYDGDRVYFPFLVTDSDAAKTAFIEDGTTARFLVTDVRDLFDWRSVAVSDDVRAVDPDGQEWDRFLETLAENGWFDPQFEAADAIESIQGWKLGLSEVDGMRRKPIRYE